MEISNQAVAALYPTVSGGAPRPATPATQPEGRDSASILYGTPVKPAPIPQSPVQTGSAQPSDPALVLYDTPSDGVWYGEPPFEQPDAVPINLPQDVVGQIGAGELPQVKAAFVSAGVGQTLANSFLDQATSAIREPITTTPEQAHAVLRQKFGAGADAKIAAARATIARAAEKWPQVYEFLDRSGLGNSPRLIEQLAAHAERRAQGETRFQPYHPLPRI